MFIGPQVCNDPDFSAFDALAQIKSQLAITNRLPVGQIKFLVINMQDFQSEGQKVMDQVCDFLEIPRHDFGGVVQKRFNSAGGSEVPHQIRKLLTGFFDQSNQELEEFMGRKLNW